MSLSLQVVAAHAGSVGNGLAVAAWRSFSATLVCGLTLTCRASKPSSRVITAHRMRAFLLAMATHAFCQPKIGRAHV